MLALALTRRRMFSEESTAAYTVTTAILFCYNARFHSETKKRRLSMEPVTRLVLWWWFCLWQCVLVFFFFKHLHKLVTKNLI